MNTVKQREGTSRNVRKKRMLAVSLFSGCGGSDIALGNLGVDVVWANDVWDKACATYAENLAPVIHEGDVRDFERFPSADLLVGCYPCQGFTQGGRRNTNDEVNFLYREFDRALRAIRPRAFVVENVGGMGFGANQELLKNQITRFRLAGYRVKSTVLNAIEYGVPQERKRIFIVGVRSDQSFEYSFPSATHGVDKAMSFASQREALSHLSDFPADSLNTEPFHWYYLSRNRRREWDSPSPCIVGHWRHVPLHPSSPPLIKLGTDEWVFSNTGQARRFTYLECAALQTFPKSFKFSFGSVRDRFQMIGNAVPPKLFEAVARPLICELKK
jgi:DNA (cytosine-5)-methyltransferase 1